MAHDFPMDQPPGSMRLPTHLWLLKAVLKHIDGHPVHGQKKLEMRMWEIREIFGGLP